MGIREVDAIPKNIVDQRKSYRMKIRDDIQEAIDRGIARFEFVGDYNYRYLAQYAREEADRMANAMIRKILAELRDENPDARFRIFSAYELSQVFPFKITSVKSEKQGERRVFCEIRDVAGLKERVRAECERLTAVREELEKERRTRRRAKNAVEPPESNAGV